jgi:hypothetical protein
MSQNATATAQRSSPRISMQVPVMVHGVCRDKTSFQEETSTIVVNAAGGLVNLASGVDIGDTVLVVNKTTRRSQECRIVYRGKDWDGQPQAAIAFGGTIPNFWRVTRREPRMPVIVPIRVRGTDPQGHRFTQSAQALDVSRHGARLDGIGYLTRPGETIEVKRRWQSARYRVLWVGDPGTPEAGQAGVYALQPGKNPWGIDFTA